MSSRGTQNADFQRTAYGQYDLGYGYLGAQGEIPWCLALFFHVQHSERATIKCEMMEQVPNRSERPPTGGVGHTLAI